MASPQHLSIDPGLQPRLLISAHHACLLPALSPRAIRLARGVFWEPAPQAERWQHRRTLSLARARAAHMTRRSPALLSHASAALHLGLPMYSQEPDVYLAVGPPQKAARAQLPVIRVPQRGDPYPSDRVGMDRRIMLWKRRLEISPDEIIVVGGLPMTHALRTAFDCAFDEPAHNALAIADSALRLVCAPQRDRPDACAPALERARAQWGALLARHPGRRGVAQARAVLSWATPWADSPLESVVRWLVLAVGMEPPRLQHRLDTRMGSAWTDLCWPQYQLIIEVNGRMKYDSRERIWRDKRRQDAIAELGWSVIRIVAQDLGDLGGLAARILARLPLQAVSALAPRRALLWPGTGLEDGLASGSALARPRLR